MLKNNKKHSKPTPPKEKPGWLRKGIASLAAFATLATGGLVAVSSANAIDNSGNGVITGGSGGGSGIGPNDFVLWLKDNLAQTAAGNPPTGWGTRNNANTSDLLSDLAKAGVDVSDSGVNKPLIQKACNQAVNNALDATHQKARVIGFATSLRGGAMWGDNAAHWKSLFEERWSQAQAQPNGGVKFFLNGWTDGDVAKFARGEFDEGMDEMAAGGTVMNQAICVAVNESQPPMAFTPTISTEAPHIIQEGQPITDRVTVGVKSGDHWIDGTSVTAKGYYFTGSKDAILKDISPNGGINSDADIASYPGRVRSGGGEYPWVAGVGVRYGLIGPDPARGRVMATQTLQGQGGKGDGGRPGVCATGVKGGPPERRHTPSLIAGRTWACMRAGRLCSLFPLRGPGGSSPFPFSVASRSGSAVSGLPCLGDLSRRQAGSPCPLLRSRSFFHTRRGWLRGCPSAVPAGSEYPSAGFVPPRF